MPVTERQGVCALRIPGEAVDVWLSAAPSRWGIRVKLLFQGCLKELSEGLGV